MVKLHRISLVEQYILESKDLTLEAKKDLEDLKDFLGDDLFDSYMKIRDRIPKDQNEFKDFNKIKKMDLKDVQDFVDNFKSKSDKKKSDKSEGAKKIYEDSDWVVYKITSYPAAQLYGKGTKWCITGRYPGHEEKGEKYFDDYIQDYNLDGGYYFYISKEDPDDKYCLLQTKDDGATLDSLNFRPEILQALRHAFEAPQGLFLVTGPTGSGKTTTLYAGLREIIARDINVTTIEDPVEYKLDGANQVQVNEKCGFTFATALRSILRQDPDVILVGEIRDQETAQIALRAAQTGHLVLATLHANSASAAAGRLADLGVPESLLRESLLGVVAQRLVRTCDAPHEYRGRTAIIEFLKPDGSYVGGTLREDAERLVQQGVTDSAEVARVLGG